MLQLEKDLEYTFRDPGLLRLALTHPSTNRADNQRLEFLGDAVLEFCVSDMLYQKYPQWQEGNLTARRAALVCEKTLATLARSWNLGNCLVMSRGEEMTGGRDRDSILCDTFEAVLAAVYLDGGIEAAKQIVDRLFKNEEQLVACPGTNFKGELQIYTQAHGLDTPVYRIVNRTGPDNSPFFTAVVEICGRETARGEGNSKQRAEQAAAKTALEILKNPTAERRNGCD